jgi:type IV secretion system protein VirB5
MLKHLRTAITASALVLALHSGAAAQGVPVSDVKGLLKQIEIYRQLLEDYGIQVYQLGEMTKQVKTLEAQLTKLQEIENLLKNPTDVLGLLMDPKYAGLLEGKFDGSMIEAIQKGASGDWSGIASTSSGSFGKAIDDVFKSAGTSQAEVSALASSDNPRARNNAAQTTSNAAVSAAAEISYQEANQLTERAQTLVSEISGLDTLKQSVDHNTRVTAELAIALAAMWQLEAVQTVNVGANGVADAATIAEVEKFLDFTSSGLEAVK